MNENNSFLLDVLEHILTLKGAPEGSIPEGFDDREYDVRFKMEPVAQHPMSSALACAAMKIIYGIVLDSEVREFQALLVCQNMVMGRFRTWFLDEETERAALQLNETSFKKRKFF